MARGFGILAPMKKRHGSMIEHLDRLKLVLLATEARAEAFRLKTELRQEQERLKLAALQTKPRRAK